MKILEKDIKEFKSIAEVFATLSEEKKTIAVTYILGLKAGEEAAEKINKR